MPDDDPAAEAIAEPARPYAVELDERCQLDGARLRQWRDGTITCPVCALRQR